MAETYVKLSQGTAIATGSNILDTDKIVGLRSGTNNITLTVTALLQKIILGLANYVTLDGAQTLLNKTLVGPKINSAVAVTATATQINHLVGVTSPIQEQINNVAGKAQVNENSIIALQTSVGNLENNEYRKSIDFSTGSFASPIYYIDKALIKGMTVEEIDPDRIIVQYYEVNGFQMIGLSQSGIIIEKDNNGLARIGLTVSTSKTYRVAISYQLQ
jgi:hypothetical protein